MSAGAYIGGRSVLVAACALATCASIAAAMVLAGLDPELRSFLGFGFGTLESSWAQAAAILANNARLLALPLAAAAGLFAMRALGTDGAEATGVRVLRVGADGVLSIVVLANVGVVGMALAAYGGRFAAALLPHGPVELLALCLALSVYLGARHGAIGVRAAAAAAGLAVLTLVGAAALEVFG